MFNIGLLHTCLNGREGHESYAPCSLDDLRRKDYDYWALGHVHKREIVCDDPWVVFPGNTQGRHARELGPKGATLVTVENERVVSVESLDLDVIRWVLCQVDAQGTTTPEQVLQKMTSVIEAELAAADGRPVAARVHITGACSAHAALSRDCYHWIQQIRLRANDLAPGEIWIEKIEIKTQAEIDLAAIAQHDDALGGLLRSIRTLQSNDTLLSELSDELADLRSKLPSELQRGEGAVDLEDTATLAEAVEDAKDLLVSRLLQRPGVPGVVEPNP